MRLLQWAVEETEGKNKRADMRSYPVRRSLIQRAFMLADMLTDADTNRNVTICVREKTRPGAVSPSLTAPAMRYDNRLTKKQSRLIEHELSDLRH